MGDWFADLFGFPEVSARAVYENLKIEKNEMHSLANGRCFAVGTLSTPSLCELRHEFQEVKDQAKGRITVSNLSGEAGELHCDPENYGALFQVASQFNLLEMLGPEVTPEKGISGYINDKTQGPSCALAAAPATVFRNYFVTVEGCSGQSRERQIDCLEDIGDMLGNEQNSLWRMKNGYALDCFGGLARINKRLGEMSEANIDLLGQKLRVGLHSGVEVTHQNAPRNQQVSQVFCSALPVGYSQSPAQEWRRFAQLILDAAYEATIGAGVINFVKTGVNKVYLTQLGGGVFGNNMVWIYKAIERALTIYEAFGLDVKIVSHGNIDDDLNELEKRWKR